MTVKDPYTREGDIRFTLRIPSELMEAIKVEAQKNKRSAGKQIEFILERWIAENASKEQVESNR